MPECPYCGRWFRSKKGLKVHITKAHTSIILGERILDPTKFDILGALERRAKRRYKKGRIKFRLI